MWLARTVMPLVSVLAILVCNTEGNPMIDLPVNDDEFLMLLGDGVKGVTKSQLKTCPCKELGGDDCRCVSFHACLDPRPEDISENYGCFNNNPLFDERTSIGIRDPNNPCGELELCCKCTRGSSPSPPPPPPPPPPPSQSQCGKRNPNGVGVIINGLTDSQTQVGEFPWMVAVLKQDTTYVAGGSLIHPKVILTAGHKVKHLDGRIERDLVARIGDWDISEARENPEPQNIDVDRIVFHPDFVRNDHWNNVALLILKKEVQYNKLVMPICLPQPNQVFDGSDCFVTGWGKDVFTAQGEFQKIMKKIPMPIINHDQCQTDLRKCCTHRLGLNYNLHNSFVCAGGLGEDACTGDGGSPLVCPDPNNSAEYVQVGVVSWGIGCNTVGNPGVYGSIPNTVDWITQTINEQTGGIDETIGFDERIG